MKSEEEDGIWFGAWIRGGTDREKHLYADTLAQMLAPVENQRYLLCHGGNASYAKEYFCVPDIFASARDKAGDIPHGADPLHRKIPAGIYAKSGGEKNPAPCQGESVFQQK